MAAKYIFNYNHFANIEPTYRCQKNIEVLVNRRMNLGSACSFQIEYVE